MFLRPRRSIEPGLFAFWGVTEWTSRSDAGKKARHAYGFDDIAIVPSRRTRDPQDVDIGWKLGPHLLELPLLASAMDGVVSPATAIALGKLGGLGVLNLEGIYTRYENPDAELERIAKLPKDRATRGLQEIYQRAASSRS